LCINERTIAALDFLKGGSAQHQRIQINHGDFSSTSWETGLAKGLIERAKGA
jgi:hypothetical protein